MSSTVDQVYGGTPPPPVTPESIKQFVAAGNVAIDDVVALNSNGTVSTVFPTSGAQVGATTEFLNAAYDNSNVIINGTKVIITYRDTVDSNRGKLIIGDISGTTVTFGTPQQFTTLNSTFNQIVYIPLQSCFVVIYSVPSGSLWCRAFTVSGTTATFGTAFDIVGAGTAGMTALSSIALGNSRFAIAGRVTTGGQSSQIHTLAVSGTTVSSQLQNSGSLLSGSTITDTQVAYDATQDKLCVFAYSSIAPTVIRSLLINGASAGGESVQAESTLITAAASNPNISVPAVFDADTGKILFAFGDLTGAPHVTKMAVVTAGATTATAGTVYTVANGLCYSHVYDDIRNTGVVLFTDTADSNRGKLKRYTYSGNVITADTNPTTFNSGALGSIIRSSLNPSLTYPLISIFNNTADLSHGYYNVMFPYATPSNVTSWIGIATSTVTNGSPVGIVIRGFVSNGFTGLTTDTTYYILEDGSYSSVQPDPSYGVLGKAVSSTEMLLTGI